MNYEERRMGGEIGETHGGETSKHRMQQIGKRKHLNCGARINQRKVNVIIGRPEMKRRK